ncbi:MAG: pyridoxal phosphate-dependent aminotransferase [Spirochaetales bacterium]|nr:pyridoxal phosphate-dependent aminotransferase [Spirochaetales bacterium]
MRRSIVWDGAGQLKYEIREIVAVAKKLEAMGMHILFENIGDPIQKGEDLDPWIKDIITGLAAEDSSYRYTDTQGEPATRKFLAAEVNKRGGCRITENDLLFFNGLGDAVAKIFGFLKREARVIGPAPAYSTLSSAEASHSGYEHLTYQLDPGKGWQPDLADIEMKIRYNPSIAGILLINPDNPTGAVYPPETLAAMVDIARKYDLFVVCDETYAHIVYADGVKTHLSEVIGDVPGMALRSISKEYPWPGGRCGWIEVFNQDRDSEFAAYIKSLLDAKRLEVCSTTLPQLSIPLVMGDPRYPAHLERRNRMFEQRAREMHAVLSTVKGITVNMPKGAFYVTVLFDDGVLNDRQTLPIANPRAKEYIEEIVRDVPVDKRFVYYLLGAEGICVVPLTGFCCTLKGFRVTLLECNDEVRTQLWHTLARSIETYLNAD